MPSSAERAKHGGVKQVRIKSYPNGTLIRVWVFKDGTTYTERVSRRGAK